MAQTSKTENLEKVRNVVKSLEQECFTNYDIVKKTELNYSQVKKFLDTLVDLDELKYSDTTKIYMRIN